MGDWLKIAQGAASGAASSAIGGIANAIMAPGAAHYNRENNRSAMDYQNQINIRNSKNKYSYELESMRRAGLNPALMQGGMSSAGVTGGTGSSSFSPDMHVNSPDISANALAMTQMDDIQKGIELKESDKKVKDNTAELIASQTEEQKIKNQHLEDIYNNYVKNQQVGIQVLEQNIKLSKAQEGVAVEQVNVLKSQVRHYDADAKRIDQLATNLKIRNWIDYNSAPDQIKLYNAQVFQAYQAGKLSQATAKQALQMANYFAAMAKKIGFENEITEEALPYLIGGCRVKAKNFFTEGIINKYRLQPLLERAKEFYQKGADLQFDKAYNELITQFIKGANELDKARKGYERGVELGGNDFEIMMGYLGNIMELSPIKFKMNNVLPGSGYEPPSLGFPSYGEFYP